jgi:uncharacterized NAD-dependent epimerase/dehydratase family protein
MSMSAGRAGAGGVWQLPKPYLVFLGDVRLATLAKTGFGVRDWAGHDCVGQWRLSPDAISLELPELDPKQAAARGARALLIGVASVGGQLPQAWIDSLVAALDAGLDLISGLHSKLHDVEPLRQAALRNARTIYDERHASGDLPIATGRKRTGRRLLTVGTDCALGKKYTALALTRALRVLGVDADFRATGQTGIMISGSGIAIDAVVADFIAGAAESLSPDAAPDHWDVIEGQGALFHPAYAGVTLGLLHGSQPDALVLCHAAGRTETAHFSGFPLPSLEDAMQAYLPHARRANPAARFVAVSLNTASLADADARKLAAETEERLGLPVFDPLRFGVDAVARSLI